MPRASVHTFNVHGGHTDTPGELLAGEVQCLPPLSQYLTELLEIHVSV
jgi:hypothetical protein